MGTQPLRLPFRSACRTLSIHAAVVAWLALFAGWAAGDSEQSYVDGLLQRQLFRLAESHCEQELKRANLDDEQRAALVIQFLKTCTQHAINVPRAQRQALWNKASAAWSDFQKSSRDEKSWPDVAFQYWISEITRGEALRLEAEVSTDRESDLAEATRTLRQSVRALRELEQQVKRLQRNKTRDSRWSDRKLNELLNQIRITIAQTMLQQSACYRLGSPDNVYLLSQARDGFASLARLTGDSELIQLSHLGQIECHRRLRDFATAIEKQQRLARTNSLSLNVQWKLTNEMARLKLDQNSPRAAIDLLQRQLKEAGREIDQNVVAQTELTLIRAYVAAWKAAAKSSKADQEKWRAAAIAQLQNMERSLPKYWVRRAEIVLSTIQSESSDFSDVEILTRSAAHQFRRKKFAEAIKTYRRAARLARDLNDPHLAFDLDYQAAAILLHVKDYRQAREAFQKVAVGYPNHINAARSHLTAITCAARLAADSSEDLSQYETLLNDHLRRWSEDPSGNQARLWLAKLQEQQGKLSDAIDTLIVIDDSFPQISEVRQRIKRAFDQLLVKLDFNSKERFELAAKAAGYFEKSVRKATSGREWSEADRDAALNAATFRLLNTNDDPTQIASILDAAVSSDGSTSQWKTRALALAGTAHLLIGDLGSARHLLGEVDWSKIDDGLVFLQRLERQIHVSGVERSRELASVMLLVSQGVTAVDKKQQRQLAQYEADALEILGKREEALAIYQRLVKRLPDDPRLQYRSAQLWEQGQTEQDLQQAMEHWRYTVRLSTPASALWFEAKLGIARTHLALGDSKRAAEVIQLTRVLHPNLGGAEMKGRFLKLLTSIEIN